ncbi:MAG TPA: aminotransferase class I/II-fold pyridoxal phosphate-dependent enzyme, partial [Burkholderiales bacterium]|nr:aminotransferase class I/II-fold pyridoxal phosphate-dependent enzyme [Burkholderiales bacterium]
MNPYLDRLQTYPFQKLSALLEAATPKPGLKPINLYIGEPKHPTPEFIKRALADNLDGLAVYPATLGAPELRRAIAKWLEQRYGIPAIDPNTQVIPVNGSREALFAIAQAVIDPTRPQPTVVCPNPFYQIYEGAALLAQATPVYLNNVPAHAFGFDWNELSPEVWQNTQLVYVCS